MQAPNVAGWVITGLAALSGALLAMQWRAQGDVPAMGLAVSIVLCTFAAVWPHLVPRKESHLAAVCRECHTPRRRGMDFCLRCGGTVTAQIKIAG